MANRKYAVRDASGKLIQKRFKNAKSARKWQALEQDKRELIRNGLELPKAVLVPIAVETYSKVFMRRRERGEVIGMIRGRRRKPAVKGTWIDEGAKFEIYINPGVVSGVRFGTLLMHTVTPDHIEDLIESAKTAKYPKKRKDVLSDAYLNRIRALLSRFFEDAILENHAIANPVAKVASRDEGRPEDKGTFWTKEECARYLAIAKDLESLANSREEYRVSVGKFFGPVFFCWAIFSLNGGPRENETLALYNSDIDLDQSRYEISKIQDPKDGFAIRERTKGKKSRTLGLNQSVVDAFLLRRNSVPFTDPGDFVFPRPDGRPESCFRIYQLHRLCCRIAKVKYIRPHDMRHTYASQFVMAGGSLEELREILGHASLTTTQRYAKFSKDHIVSKATVFEIGAPEANVVSIERQKKD
jgi:integrase